MATGGDRTEPAVFLDNGRCRPAEMIDVGAEKTEMDNDERVMNGRRRVEPYELQYRTEEEETEARGATDKRIVVEG